MVSQSNLTASRAGHFMSPFPLVFCFVGTNSGISSPQSVLKNKALLSVNRRKGRRTFITSSVIAVLINNQIRKARS